jgi:hypothetical protein
MDINKVQFPIGKKTLIQCMDRAKEDGIQEGRAEERVKALDVMERMRVESRRLDGHLAIDNIIETYREGW